MRISRGATRNREPGARLVRIAALVGGRAPRFQGVLDILADVSTLRWALAWMLAARLVPEAIKMTSPGICQ